MFRTNLKYKLSMLWNKIRSPFTNIVYHIKRYFEIKYWYWWRSETPLWYDEDSGKWREYPKYYAKDIIRSWWDAETNLLDMVMLKINHMYYKLKKDGHHSWQYLDSYVLSEKYATKSDKEWGLKQALSSLINPKMAKEDYRVDIIKKKSNPKFRAKKDIIELSRWIGNIEEFDGHKLDKLEGKINIGKTLTEKETKELEELRELKKTAESESGLIHYYIVHKITADSDSYLIRKKVDCQIPYKRAKSASYYTMNDTRDKKDILDDIFIPIPEYRVKKIETVLEFDNFESLVKVDKLIKDKLGIELNVESNFLADQQTFEVKNSDFRVLSKKVKEQVRGRRRDLIHLLEVRRAVKRILQHDDYDAKYNTWLEAPEETRREEMKKCRKLYEENRKKLYREFADIMAKYGETFWD